MSFALSSLIMPTIMFPGALITARQFKPQDLFSFLLILFWFFFKFYLLVELDRLGRICFYPHRLRFLQIKMNPSIEVS